jgi:hypothetical protein
MSTETSVLYLGEHTDLVDKSFLNMYALDVFYRIPRGSDVDFTGVTLDYYHVIQLANLLESFQLNPINLAHPSDILLLTALHYVREPKITFEEYIEQFAYRFPVGSVCIKDTLFCVDNPRVGKTTSVLVIEELRPLTVRARRYHASAFEPDLFFGRGGCNSTSNYLLENLGMNDLFHKFPFIRHAISQQELDALNYFFPDGSIIIR